MSSLDDIIKTTVHYRTQQAIDRLKPMKVSLLWSDSELEAMNSVNAVLLDGFRETGDARFLMPGDDMPTEAILMDPSEFNLA